MLFLLFLYPLPSGAQESLGRIEISLITQSELDCARARAAGYGVDCRLSQGLAVQRLFVICPLVDNQALADLQRLFPQATEVFDQRLQSSVGDCGRGHDMVLELNELEGLSTTQLDRGGNRLPSQRELAWPLNPSLGLDARLAAFPLTVHVNAAEPEWALCEQLAGLGLEITCGTAVGDLETNITLTCPALPDGAAEQLASLLGFSEVQVYDLRARQADPELSCRALDAWSIEIFERPHGDAPMQDAGPTLDLELLRGPSESSEAEALSLLPATLPEFAGAGWLIQVGARDPELETQVCRLLHQQGFEVLCFGEDQRRGEATFRRHCDRLPDELIEAFAAWFGIREYDVTDTHSNPNCGLEGVALDVFLP